MKRTNKIIALLLCLAIIVCSLNGCRNTTEDSEYTSSLPSVSVSVIEESEPTEKDIALYEEAKSEDANIHSMVMKAIIYDLQEKGYDAMESIAFSKNYEYKQSGIGYYSSDIKFFEDKDYAGVGFVSVIGPNDKYCSIPDDAEYIAVEPVDQAFHNNARFNIMAYSCESLEDNHFIFDGKYILYYQLDANTIKYDILDNLKENYNLSIGSLYDYDNNSYVYDEQLFDNYVTHSGEELFSKQDYDELEKELKEVSKQQEKNGYSVEELNIVYISPENIEAYLASNEEETFFGYSVAELEKSIGKGKALVYTEEGFQTAEYYESNPKDYNWKSFLAKVGIGCGIILIGAVLTPITGGASFGCALLTISKVTVGIALSSGLGTLAIETVANMMKGDDIENAIMHASCKGLDSFANGFMIGAAIGSVGVVSGIIKPVACFTAGTLVAVAVDGGIGYKNIDSIKPGDRVYSYNEENGTNEIDLVSGIIEKNTDEIIELLIEDEKISVTKEHPFYNPTRNEWISADNLKYGDSVLLLDGSIARVMQRRVVEEITPVYNITVNNNHNYYVGRIGILVHNDCTTIESLRKKGVREAWRKEVEAVKQGKSKYNWTENEIDELLTSGSVKGYDGCHIKDVHLNKELASNPDNIIFLKHDVHIRVVHGGYTKNPSQWGEIIKIMPQFKDQIVAMGGII